MDTQTSHSMEETVKTLKMPLKRPPKPVKRKHNHLRTIDQKVTSCIKGRKTLALLAGVAIGCFLSVGFIAWVVFDESFGRWNDVYADSLQSHSFNDSHVYNTSFPVEPSDASHNNNQSEFGTASDSPDVEVIADKTFTVAVRSPIYVAILALESYLSTRGAACNRTWAQARSSMNQVEFFSHLESHQQNLPNVIDLPDISSDDHYHQEKMMQLIRAVCKRRLDEFDWFLFTTDDVFVRMEYLLVFLKQFDKLKKMYIGHGTLAMDDASFRVLHGSEYCRLGPGIVLSRPLLADLCDNLSRCEVMLDVPAEVWLGHCIKQTTKISCSSFHNAFFDSFLRDSMEQVEEFTSLREAVTFHPVKEVWLMYYLHQHFRRTLFADMKQYTSSLIKEREMLTSPSRQSNHAAIPFSKHVISDIVMFHDVTSVHSTSSCSFSETSSIALKTELEKLVELANSTCRTIDSLHCPRILSGYYQRQQTGTNYFFILLCKRKQGGDTQDPFLAKVSLRRDLAEPRFKKIRNRPVAPIVIILSTHQRDMNFIRFMLMLKGLNFTEKKADVVTYAILNEDRESAGNASKLYTPFIDASALKNWFSKRHLSLAVRSDENQESISSRLAKDVLRQYPGSVILVTRPELHFTRDFLLRCGSLARQGKQMYKPLYSRERTPGPSSSKASNILRVDSAYSSELLMDVFCIHVQDLTRILGSNHRSQTGGTGKKLKVTRAFDKNLVLMDPFF